MRKFLLLCTFVLLGANASARAQGGSNYRIDNFDMREGVRVEPAREVKVVPPTSKLPPSKVAAQGRASRASSPVKLISYVRPLPVNMSQSRSLDGFTTGNPKVDSLIINSGTRWRVDPVLLYATMHQESAFKPHAVSYKGAAGLMQLMPGTATRFGVRNRFDPQQNIEGGARYMRLLLDMFGGDVSLALAGYNAGEGAVLQYGRRIPPYRETQEYVRRITGRYALMRNPQTARTAPTATPTQIAAIQAAPPIPPTLYERGVSAVRMPDGKLRLLSQ